MSSEYLTLRDIELLSATFQSQKDAGIAKDIMEALRKNASNPTPLLHLHFATKRCSKYCINHLYLFRSVMLQLNKCFHACWWLLLSSFATGIYMAQTKYSR